MEKLLKLVNIYRRALELACLDSSEYDCDDRVRSKTLEYLVEKYVKRAQKEIEEKT